MTEHLNLGIFGEKYALNYLKEKGYKIITCGYKRKTGEIDIIAKKKKRLVFVEVKTRSNNSFGGPLLAVGKSKQKRIVSTAIYYLKENKIKPQEISFDVIAILEGYKIEHITNAFTPQRFSY